MIQLTTNELVRTITDDANPRIHVTEYKCCACRRWVADDDTVWIPNWSTGQPYHLDCAPDEGDPC